MLRHGLLVLALVSLGARVNGYAVADPAAVPATAPSIQWATYITTPDLASTDEIKSAARLGGNAIDIKLTSQNWHDSVWKHGLLGDKHVLILASGTHTSPAGERDDPRSVAAEIPFTRAIASNKTLPQFGISSGVCGSGIR